MNAGTQVQTHTYTISEHSVCDRGQKITHFSINYRGKERGFGWSAQEAAEDFAARNPQYGYWEVRGNKMICTVQ